MPEQPPILFLPRFSFLGASSRYRCYQYLPFIRSSGMHSRVSPLFDSTYLQLRYQGRGRPVIRMIKAYARRLKVLRDAPRNIPLWIEKELFPWLPGEFEHIILKGRRYILDFDDAIHVWYARYPVFRNKVGMLSQGAFEIHAGNEFLAEELRRLGGKVHLLPTVLNPDEYRARTVRAGSGKLVLGWIGSPLSRCHLESLLPILERCHDVPLELHCMGAGDQLATNISQYHFPWSSQSEKEFCAGLDVGLMPLTADDFSQGKCGFKLLQYMSANVAVIAGDSLANRTILEGGKHGILASSDQDWIDGLKKLHTIPGLLESLGASGGKRVREAYSLQTHAPFFQHAVLRLMNAG